MPATTALLLLPALALAQGTPSSPLEALAREARERSGIPGLAVAVVLDGGVVAQAAAGVRRLGSPAPIEPQDHFLAGSCTKAMTRVLLARLAQAGTLDLDQPLAKALPGVPMREDYRKATVRDVALHRAGLQPYTRIGPRVTPALFELKGPPEARRAAFVRQVLQQAPAGRPGEEEVYSNAGYALLGALAEQAAGKPWEALMAEEVFAPLGMAGARLGRSEELGLGPGPEGHGRGPGGFEAGLRAPPITGALAPAGAANLTLADFAAFAAALADAEAGRPSAFLGPKGLKALASLRPPGKGPPEGAVLLGSEGTFTAGFALWPSRRLAVVVLTNGGFADEVPEELIEAARARYAPGALPVARPPRQGPGGPPPGDVRTGPPPR